jgi:hypothetical protein
MQLDLQLHPDGLCDPISGIEVELVRSAANCLHLNYRVSGKIEELLVPQQAVSERQDGLWRHMCLEAFLKSGSGPSYREYNFSPSTAWSAYEFSDYRAEMRDLSTLPPEIETITNSHYQDVKVAIKLGDLSDIASLRIGLSAVIETRDGQKSYWALAHPLGPADFHHDDCFAAQLPAPGAL